MSWSLEDIDDDQGAWIVGHARTANCAKILIPSGDGAVCWPSDWTGPNWLRDQGLIEFGDLADVPEPFESALRRTLEAQYAGSFYARSSRDRYKPRGRRVTLTAKGRQRLVKQSGGES